jgi:hypothetical protein
VTGVCGVGGVGGGGGAGASSALTVAPLITGADAPPPLTPSPPLLAAIGALVLARCSALGLGLGLGLGLVVLVLARCSACV